MAPRTPSDGAVAAAAAVTPTKTMTQQLVDMDAINVGTAVDPEILLPASPSATDDDAGGVVAAAVAAEPVEPLPLPEPPAPVPFTDEEAQFMQRSVYCLAASMFFTFAMFAPVQNVVTTVYPDSGTISLVLVYFFFTASTVVAPSFVRWVGAPNGVIIGCAGYLLYSIGCMTGQVAVFLLLSCLIGLCAGTIWTSQGAVLTTLSSAENRGRNSALIIGGVRLAAIITNLLLGYLLGAKVSVSAVLGADGAIVEPEREEAKFSSATIFAVFLLIGCVGMLFFLILRVRMLRVTALLERRAAAEKEAKDAYTAELEEVTRKNAAITGANDASNGDGDSTHLDITPTPSVPVTLVGPPSLLLRLKEIFICMRSKHYKYLVPILFVQGFSVSFFFGAFGVIMGKNFLGFAQSAMGVCSVTIITTLGRHLDKIPRAKTASKKKFLYATLGLHIVFAMLYDAHQTQAHKSDENEAQHRWHHSERTRARSFSSHALCLFCVLLFGLQGSSHHDGI
jgi:hypothetical protein